MTLIDTHRPFVGDTRLMDLVHYVNGAIAVNESLWLEWKVGLDLMGKNEDVFAVAKAILAFSNRSPEVAARTAGGFAYMVIGAQPDEIRGQAQIDNVDLLQKVTPFVGTEVGWRPHWVRVDNKDVLIVEVDPPNWGDQIHPLQKQADKVLAGQLYVRKPGGSHPANPTDLRVLEDRLVRRPWRVSVRQIGALPARLAITDEAIEEYVAKVRRRLIEPMEMEEHRKQLANSPRPSALRMFGFHEATINHAMKNFGGLVEGESRSFQRFRDEVNDHCRDLSASLPGVAAAHMTLDNRCNVDLVLNNLCDDNLEDVSLEFLIDGEFFVPGDYETKHLQLPTEPRPWGSHIPALRLASSISSSSFGVDLRMGFRDSRPRVSRSGSDIHVVFPTVSLRPKRPAALATISMVGLGAVEILTCQWSATTKSKSGEDTGVIEIRLGPTVNLESALHFSETEAD